ncbi:MAG: hypothetical protein ACTSXY_04345 [Promethearchaeota archaeon]
MIPNNSKKVLLDKIYYEINNQQDFYVAGTYKKNGETLFTKWKKYSEAIFPIDFDGTCREDWKAQKYFEQIDQRQILPIEVVLDIEEKKQIKPIVIILKNLKSIDVGDYFIYETGSRGYHIHIFFKEELSEKEKLFFVKKFGTDIQKCSEKCLIALEGVPHWKTGNPKKEVSKEEILNG